jgi:Ca2+:H+ antiporter
MQDSDVAATWKSARGIGYVGVPVVAIVCLAFSWGRDLPLGILAVLAAVLAAAVLSAVHHAEIIALRVGEPYGSLVLAVAVTIIEVALIVTLMASSEKPTESLARDTVFAALMITCNGIIGAALLVSTLRGGTARFNAAGAGSGLAAIGALATLSLVLPTFTQSSQGPTFTTSQLAFAALAALVVYLLFVFVQTVRHRDYFLPPTESGRAGSEDAHAERPTNRATLVSLLLLALCLVSVVGLAKVDTPLIESVVTGVGLPLTAVAVAIALLVLLPESIAALRAARQGRFQTSVNLAYGSAMASIGLTIPTIAVASWLFGYNLVLGLSPVEITLLAITLVTGILTVTPGRATLLQGGIHLTLFAAFLVLVVSP